MANTMYNDVLVLARSGKDIYLGRASGSSEVGFKGEWINTQKNNSVTVYKELYGFNFMIVDDLIINNFMGASRILMKSQ